MGLGGDWGAGGLGPRAATLGGVWRGAEVTRGTAKAWPRAQLPRAARLAGEGCKLDEPSAGRVRWQGLARLWFAPSRTRLHTPCSPNGEGLREVGAASLGGADAETLILAAAELQAEEVAVSQPAS